jgi:hypothetical protein
MYNVYMNLACKIWWSMDIFKEICLHPYMEVARILGKAFL